MNIIEENKENTQTKRREKTKMKKLKKNVKGITLIALVVTIIVLLILAGVALNLTIGQNGIFQRAQDAANTWRNAETNEQLAMQEGADLIGQYLNGNGGNNDNPDTGAGTALGAITGNETSNTTTKDKYGNPITIPAGFKVVNPDDDVTKGIVIEDVSAPGKTSDTKGSQFVWIPVGDVITDEEGSKTTITLGRYTFDSSGVETLVQSAENWNQEVAIETYFKELATRSYGNAIAKNLKDFIDKATTSGGYYIGRYEAGDALATTSARTGTTNVSNPSNPITCKAGVCSYNYVNQADASNLARTMYSSSNFDSDLINSYAWDTAIVFIQTFSGDTDYSRQTSLQSTLARCGEATNGTNNDVRCNVYDMAGNTREWTTETVSYTYSPCVGRGGYYGNSSYYTSYRYGNNTTYSGGSNSFRPTLYL